jgi:hypothetical protein
MAHWRKEMNPTYLGSWDFPNGDKTLTIKSAGQDIIADGMNKGKPALIIHWQENEKPMICNVVNGKTIAKALKSPDLDNWTGKKITLYATTTMVAGSEEECVRVRPFAPTVAETCADCGGEIKAAKGLTGARIAEQTLTKYGRKLCAECAGRAKQEADLKTAEKEGEQK